MAAKKTATKKTTAKKTATKATVPERVQGTKITKPHDPTLNIHERLHLVCQAITYVERTQSDAGGLGFSYVTHDSVTKLVRPELTKVGVICYPQNQTFNQSGNCTQVELDLRFASIDTPADYIEVPCLGFGVDDSDKGPGMAVSYAIKMGLLKALGLETGADEGSKPPAKKSAPKATAPAAPATKELAKKDASDALEVLKKEMQSNTTEDQLLAWATQAKKRIDALPTIWRNDFNQSYAEFKQSLINKGVQ